ncbi:secreted and transmembrane protein 1A-like isoform X1 [Peromyscus leucopus]|uniref:secreted and transmembrane protein 1A-like isoform X1 n=1 Tax=Peromyscus leucopus TaxID=10041 RepID=UPI0010A1B2E5|nr:secreted and transmembrane protein 1A-like isoform X1 [Peromyscus leucopus]
MKTRPSVSIVHTPRMFSILLLAVSLNAQNESWDSPICTEDMLSVPRGSRTVMTCNISNSFTDVSIWLIANGKEMAIFMKKPQGNFHWGGWEFHVQGGQAQLVIKDTQDIHTGLYLWQLHGRQKVFKNITLDVSEPSNKDEATDTRLSTSPPGRCHNHVPRLLSIPAAPAAMEPSAGHLRSYTLSHSCTCPLGVTAQEGVGSAGGKQREEQDCEPVRNMPAKNQ